MEIILVLIVIFIISRRKGTFSSIPIQDLPIGTNEDKTFDDKAFTVYYLKLKDNDGVSGEQPSPDIEEVGQVG